MTSKQNKLDVSLIAASQKIEIRWCKKHRQLIKGAVNTLRAVLQSLLTPKLELRELRPWERASEIWALFPSERYLKFAYCNLEESERDCDSLSFLAICNEGRKNATLE